VGVRRRRGPDLDEPVELLDDGWERATPVTTSTRSRGRWPEALLVVAVLAVVLGIGATSGGDDDEDATDMPRRTTTTARRQTSSTRPRPSTTTTTWPARVAGTGPVLGAGTAPTGTALVVAEADGTVAVLDLDTGDLCRAQAGRNPWFPMPQPSTTDEALVVDEGGRSLRIDASCDVEPGNRGRDPWSFRAATEDTYWITEDGPITRIVEHSTADDSTLRVIEIPYFNGMFADDRTMVVTAAGEMVAVDLYEDRTVPLGSGQPIALGGGRLVALRCADLDCAVVLIDVETGRTRPLAIAMPSPWETASLSPDGRWLSYNAASTSQTLQNQGVTEPVVANLDTGETVETRGGPCTFTADSRWLLCVRPSVIEAVRIEDGLAIDLSKTFDRPTNGFATMRTGSADT
jgi:hypothetical protein